MKCDPIEAVFLALDPAKHTSGACTLLPDYGNGMIDEDEHPFEGTYCLGEWGKVESQSERKRFLEEALGEADDAKLPLIVIAEEWDPPRHRRVKVGGQFCIVLDQKWTPATLYGMGEGWGLWQAEITALNEFLEEERRPPIIVVRVKPNIWRRGLWERPPKKSKDLKIAAQRYFEGVFGFKVQEDVAESGCIGLWGTTAQVVAEALEAWQNVLKPKKRVKPKKKR